MNWLAFAFALEVGLLPINGWQVYESPSEVIERPEFYQQMEARVILWDHLFAGGKVRVYDWLRQDVGGFYAQGAAFTLEAGLTFGGLELGWRHWCGVHPLTPYLERVPQRIMAEGAYEEVYLRLEGKIGGK